MLSRARSKTQATGGPNRGERYANPKFAIRSLSVFVQSLNPEHVLQSFVRRQGHRTYPFIRCQGAMRAVSRAGNCQRCSRTLIGFYEGLTARTNSPAECEIAKTADLAGDSREHCERFVVGSA